MEVAMATVLGQRMLRREDPPLLTGEARFVDDLAVAGAAWVTLVRSPHARARIRAIDVSAARAADGVVSVVTGEDLRGEWGGPMPCAWPVTDDMRHPDHWPLAVGEARFVGEPVAAVVATSRTAAADAAELVVVDYEPLPAVTELDDALSDATLVHEALGTNRSYTWELIPDPAAVDAAFANAAHVVHERYVQQRLI